MNHPPINRLSLVHKNFAPSPMSIAVLTTKFWRTNGVRLTVGFMDNPSFELRNRIISHMNAWNKTANVKFVFSGTDPQVRIARTGGSGHWSYLGTDVLLIKPDEPTMNLDSFTMNTPNSEFHRVVRHETGHTLGCPHEHMRGELVALIDEEKAIKFFGENQGWDPDMVRRQVLTPLEEASISGSATADAKSIMCYQIPGEVTKSGKPIVGGLDIDKSDFEFMGTIYPKPSSAPSKPKAKATAKKGSAKKATKKASKNSSSKASKKASSKASKKSSSKSSRKASSKTSKKSTKRRASSKR
jgi:hypothetical protein